LDVDTTALTPDAQDLVARLRRGELVAAPRPPVDDLPEPEPTPLAPARGAARLTSGWRATLADRLPLTLRGALVDPAARGAVLLGVVALLAALVALGLAWRAAPRSVALPPASVPVVTGAAPASPPPAAAGPSPSPSPPGRVVVDVAGKVRHPGIVTLATGARVADALGRAGGVLPGTDTSALSLARRVTDGEQVLVTGKPGTAPAVAATPAPGAADSGGGAAPAADPSSPLDLNTATVEQFDGLPGVGPVLASRIVEYRTAHNGFTSVDQLHEVKGLGGKTGAELLPLVRVG
jgi:competence protein ComEA